MKIEGNVEIAVLEEKDTEYSREFLGELEEKVDHWIETVEGKTYERVRGQIIEYVSGAYDLGLENDQGVVFPERPSSANFYVHIWYIDTT